MSDGATLIKTLLSVTPAPAIVEGESPKLTQSIVAESGETNLSMANKILTAINWRIRIEGDGTIYILPQPEEAVASFDPFNNDSIKPQLKKKYDWYDCPNVFRAVYNDVSALARDDSEDSPLSTINRGREIWKEETECNLNTGESIAAYAKRRLEEKQRVSTTLEYERRFFPNIKVADFIKLNYPKQGIVGTYKVTSQTIDLEHSGETSETVEKVLVLLYSNFRRLYRTQI